MKSQAVQAPAATETAASEAAVGCLWRDRGPPARSSQACLRALWLRCVVTTALA